EAQPAADRRTLHRGYDRLRASEELQRSCVKPAAGTRASTTRARCGETCAGTECLADRGENDRAAGRFRDEPAEAIGDGIEQRHVEEVVGRPTDLDDPNMFLQINGDIVARKGCHRLTHHALSIGLMMAQ